jgi:hypothetical protein
MDQYINQTHQTLILDIKNQNLTEISEAVRRIIYADRYIPIMRPVYIVRKYTCKFDTSSLLNPLKPSG